MPQLIKVYWKINITLCWWNLTSSFLKAADSKPIPVEENLFTRVIFRVFRHEVVHFLQGELGTLIATVQNLYTSQQEKIVGKYNKFGNLPSGRGRLCTRNFLYAFNKLWDDLIKIANDDIIRILVHFCVRILVNGYDHLAAHHSHNMLWLP